MSGGSIGGTLGTALGVALAPETGGLSLAIPGFAGAAGSALGGAMTGSKNIWRDALLGGIGGAAGGGLNNLSGNASGLGDLFKTGGDISNALPSWAGGTSGIADAAGSTLSSGSPLYANAAASGFENAPGQIIPSLSNASSAPSLFSGVANGAANSATSAATSPSIWGNVAKFAPYAALSGGAILADNLMKPKVSGPPMQSHPSNPGRVSPLARTSQNVDPNSYYAPATAGARSFFGDYTMQPQFMAKGGVVKRYANGGSSSASSSNIPAQRSRQVKGAGDGRSDSIPAQLSDGEFVISAPVVSALGNGSNDAGAKKLGTMQKKVLQKHYKGGKPHKAMGLGSYVH